MEIWKDITGYEGLYQVSNLGNVKSLRTNKNIYCSKSGRTKEYLRVGLFKDKKRTMYSIHKLVAEHFVPNPNKYPIVNHKDERKNNNVWTNLEWCDEKYNANYGTKKIKAKCSSLLYLLKKNYNNEKELIAIAEKLNEMIRKLNVN
jgi:hypothetical protein